MEEEHKMHGVDVVGDVVCCPVVDLKSFREKSPDWEILQKGFLDSWWTHLREGSMGFLILSQEDSKDLGVEVMYRKGDAKKSLLRTLFQVRVSVTKTRMWDEKDESGAKRRQHDDTFRRRSRQDWSVDLKSHSSLELTLDSRSKTMTRGCNFTLSWQTR